MRGAVRLLCAGALALLATSAGAQTYPAKPITIVVPFAAGSGTNLITRIVAQQLSVVFNQSVVVENKAGARSAGTCHLRRACRARRLHAADGDQLDALGQSASVQVAVLRSGEGFHAGRARRFLRVHAGGQPGPPGARRCPSLSPTPRPIPAS